ncbi:hypothetical protein Mapa_004671 [Marchantia paleacea]|nr:hypothetical protein Mapa_004671 [Marchantia paleacea]
MTFSPAILVSAIVFILVVLFIWICHLSYSSGSESMDFQIDDHGAANSSDPERGCEYSNRQESSP